MLFRYVFYYVYKSPKKKILSSQCLAAFLSEEPSRDIPNPQPNQCPQLEEAHGLGEPSELDNDFSMDL